MTKNQKVRPAAATGFVALALLVTACGGGSAKTATSATTTTTAAGRAARLASYRQCLQSHGVTLPANAAGGGFGAGRGAGGNTSGTAPTTTLPPGVTEQQWQAAITACAGQLPTRGGGNLQNNPQFQVYYNCLQTYLMTHGGTTLPPISQGGGGIFGGGGGGGPGGPGSTASGNTTTTNPTLQAARDHCDSLRPTFGGGGTTTTSTP